MLWGKLVTGKRRFFLGGSVVFVVSVVLVLVFFPVLNSIMASIVEFLYRAPPNTWPGIFFGRIAQNAGNIPMTSYLEKSIKILVRGISACIIFMTVLMAGILAYWVKAPLSAVVSAFVGQTIKAFTIRQMWFAGLMLGFATAIRVLGPYAGVIVLVYMIIRLRQRALPLVLPYLFVSFLFMYIFWPFLWKSPIINFLNSAATMSAFPWIHDVLFNGIFYKANNLPIIYLPTLITIQITESVIFLLLLGLVYLLMKLKQQDYLLLFLVFVVWFVVPVAGVMVFRPVLYDNFRQFLFIVPPLFLVAGLGLELIFRYLQNKAFRIIILFVLIIPAIYVNIQLYPFEYVYYNSFVGGTKGAFRRFEMDYWLTAYREAAEYINANEINGAQIIGLPVEMSTFATNLGLYEDSCDERPLYAVVTSRWNGDKTEYETAPIIYSIKRDDAVLMVIRELPCPPPPP